MSGACSGKIAIVTGAGRGIGKACAQRLLDEGAKVVACDITAPDWPDGAGAVGIKTDVANRSELQALVDATIECFGIPDILINNAGILLARNFLDQTEQEFDDTIRVNLKSSFLLTQMVARHLIENGRGGAVVNMSSINASLALATHAAYSMSKSGLAGLTNVAAVALAPYGIRVNAVAPGTIATEMVRTFMAGSPEMVRSIQARTPAGRVGEVSEVAAAVAFLASDSASYITGQTLLVDGGRSVLNMTMPQ